MIALNSINDLTPQVIKKVVEQHRGTILPRLEKLERYYENKNDIKNRLMTDPTKPNNKASNAYASYITDTLVGYFVGEPITYNSNDKDLLQELNMIFEYNDESDENSELAKDASIFGVAYEQLYVAQDKTVRFKRLNPKEVIRFCDKTIEENLIAVLRYYTDYDYLTNKTSTIIEIIDSKQITRYRTGETIGELEFLDETLHYFGMVPIATYQNNEDESGDFEKVISLIDAYDKMESDTLNDFEYFCDAYLALYGYSIDPEDKDELKKMKEQRVLLLDQGTSAEWLVKQPNDSYVENMKNRLDKDIHKFSKCPNMSDQEFAGNASGIAIKFKMLGTENLVSIKERKFKRGIQQRLELLASINAVLSDGFDWRSIEIIFKRNLPSNDVDIANMVNTLSGIVSEETLLAQIPFVDDVGSEIEKIEKERDKKKEISPFFQSTLDYQTKAMINSTEQDSNKEEE